MPKIKSKTVMMAGAALLLVFLLAALFLRHEHKVHLARLEGAWEGALHFHGGRLMRTQRMVLRVFTENGTTRAVLDEIDLGRKSTAASHLDAGWTMVNFTLASGVRYQGTVNADGTEITGRWTWPGGNYSQPLALERTANPDAVPEPLAAAEYAPRPGSDLQGLWKAVLILPDGTNRLHLHFKVSEPSAGNFRAELNSIDQPPVLSIPANAVSYDHPHVKLSFQGVGVIFEGDLNEAGSQIAGTWTQAKPNPLTLERASAGAETTSQKAAN